jgi:hypothetical protein
MTGNYGSTYSFSTAIEEMQALLIRCDATRHSVIYDALDIPKIVCDSYTFCSYKNTSLC